ncbi:hypothetical protein BAU15_10125 [Enterococcus sp. JM4C]|uniref:DUF72 domain-containing protein n=1 Tax=Candidatus Enterococcus huntleyi TaxID=1857217 RepID=UPI00137959E6|nr:DUF72 domain-containing protein [Enterococcus sp. JM4C]KAF1296136.1 hypothetical protein BAU15_10125 [Enterococcus sp. JM4C]
MIRIGLTSFKEHDKLTGKPNNTLYEYAGYLPFVELDTAYYGIPRKTSVEKWVAEVPTSFRFVVKVYQGISGQGKWQDYYASEAEMFTRFLEAMAPMIQSGKLYCFLVQFPSTFKCTKESVAYLERIRVYFGELPIAIELRDFSWYSDKMIKGMRSFMEQHKFSLAIIDEPQLLNTTVPFDPYVTNPEFALFRLHGRNANGWQSNDADWRKKRTLYRYNQQELSEILAMLTEVQAQTKEVGIIFNNNSGGDAADNAMALKRIAGISYDDLNPAQIDLF